MLRTTSLLLAAALLSTGCGGGGGSGGTSALVPTTGNVFALNGQSTNLAGVQIEVPITGASTVSAGDGTFDLGLLPPTLLTLRITPPGGSPLRTAMVVASEVEVDLSGAQEAQVHLSVNDDGIAESSVDRCSGGDGDNETEAPLAIVTGSASGEIEVRVRADGHTGFDVEVEDLAPGSAVEVFVINPTTMAAESQGTIVADGLGEAELELRTNDGDRLPFGVADVSFLEDFVVEIRNPTGGAVLLRGTVPAAGAAPTCTPGGGGGNAGREKGEAILTNGSGVSGLAKVELRSRPARGEEKIEVEVTGTNVAGTIQVWLEDPSNAGTLTQVGVLTPEGLGLEYERDTEDGDLLPYGAANAAALVGLQIELRQTDGTVVYSGITPPINPS